LTTRRAFELQLEHHSLLFPAYFPSISSVRTNLKPLEYLAVVVATHHPSIFISAYDIARSDDSDQPDICRLLGEARTAGAVVMIDSGKYESYWKNDETWRLEEFQEVIRKCDFDLGFADDNQDPPSSESEAIDCIVRGVLRDSNATGKQLNPIAHASTALLADVCVGVSRRLQPQLLGIPERCLGSGIRERAETLRSIRGKLGSMDRYQAIHLLGTGDPLSILLLTLCGADSFDGLEWCKTAVDHTTAQLHHFHQYDLFAHQADVGDTDIIGYEAAVMSHNLLFYRSWLHQAHDALAKGKLTDMVRRFLPNDVLDNLLNGLR